MPFSAGDKLGPYEILAPIGAGGMGDVYKARDTRLDRIVAVKVSKEQFSERFEREARTVAALNHPNICTLYDVGPNYLVMEYVEGEPLKACALGGWRHAVRSADRRWGGGRALQGHRSSRSETGEHFRHARRPREDPGFRARHATSTWRQRTPRSPGGLPTRGRRWAPSDTCRRSRRAARRWMRAATCGRWA